MTNREELLRLRNEIHKLIYSTDDTKVTNRDYLCGASLELAILRKDVEDIKRDIKTIKRVLMTR